MLKNMLVYAIKHFISCLHWNTASPPASYHEADNATHLDVLWMHTVAFDECFILLNDFRSMSFSQIWSINAGVCSKTEALWEAAKGPGLCCNLLVRGQIHIFKALHSHHRKSYSWDRNVVSHRKTKYQRRSVSRPHSELLTAPLSVPRWCLTVCVHLGVFMPTFGWDVVFSLHTAFLNLRLR